MIAAMTFASASVMERSRGSSGSSARSRSRAWHSNVPGARTNGRASIPGPQSSGPIVSAAGPSGGPKEKAAWRTWPAFVYPPVAELKFWKSPDTSGP